MLLCLCFQGWQFDTRWPMSFLCLSNRKAISDRSLSSAPAWLQSIIQDSKGNTEKPFLRKQNKQKDLFISIIRNIVHCIVDASLVIYSYLCKFNNFLLIYLFCMPTTASPPSSAPLSPPISPLLLPVSQYLMSTHS